MQVTMETTEGLERQLKITVPSEIIEKTIVSELKKISKNKQFDGFRKGKAPLSMVSRMYESSVRQDVLNELMQKHFFDAIMQEKLNPAGAPTFSPEEIKKDSDLVFKATFEVYPEVTISGLDKIKVEKPTCSISDADIDEMIETLQKQQSSWIESNDKVDHNSKVKINFEGKIDGEVFDGGKAESFELEMGQGKMIPGFEDGIVGHIKGDKFDVETQFPEDYHAENLKGKTAVFSIEVLDVLTRELPKLDDNFASKFGIKEGGIAALKTEIEKNMNRELKQTIKNKIKDMALNGLLENNEIDIPKSLIDQEIEVLKKQALQQFGGNMKNTPELPNEIFSEQAKKRVSIGLLLGEFIKQEKIEADDTKTKELIADIASAYEDPSEVIEYYNKDEKIFNNMKNLALEEEAIEKILSSAQVTEKEFSFNELMKK